MMSVEDAVNKLPVEDLVTVVELEEGVTLVVKLEVVKVKEIVFVGFEVWTT